MVEEKAEPDQDYGPDVMAERVIKIEATEYLPKGFLELEPLLFKNEYEFLSSNDEKYFDEDQRRAKEMRRHQYQLRNQPKAREVVIYKIEYLKKKAAEILEKWFQDTDNPMDDLQIAHYSSELGINYNTFKMIHDIFMEDRDMFGKNNVKLNKLIYHDNIQQTPNKRDRSPASSGGDKTKKNKKTLPAKIDEASSHNLETETPKSLTPSFDLGRPDLPFKPQARRAPYSRGEIRSDDSRLLQNIERLFVDTREPPDYHKDSTSIATLHKHPVNLVQQRAESRQRRLRQEEQRLGELETSARLRLETAIEAEQKAKRKHDSLQMNTKNSEKESNDKKLLSGSERNTSAMSPVSIGAEYEQRKEMRYAAEKEATEVKQLLEEARQTVILAEEEALKLLEKTLEDTHDLKERARVEGEEIKQKIIQEAENEKRRIINSAQMGQDEKRQTKAVERIESNDKKSSRKEDYIRQSGDADGIEKKIVEDQNQSLMKKTGKALQTNRSETVGSSTWDHKDSPNKSQGQNSTEMMAAKKADMIKEIARLSETKEVRINKTEGKEKETNSHISVNNKDHSQIHTKDKKLGQENVREVTNFYVDQSKVTEPKEYKEQRDDIQHSSHRSHPVSAEAKRVEEEKPSTHTIAKLDKIEGSRISDNNKIALVSKEGKKRETDKNRREGVKGKRGAKEKDDHGHQLNQRSEDEIDEQSKNQKSSNVHYSESGNIDEDGKVISHQQQENQDSNEEYNRMVEVWANKANKIERSYVRRGTAEWTVEDNSDGDQHQGLSYHEASKKEELKPNILSEGQLKSTEGKKKSAEESKSHKSQQSNLDAVFSTNEEKVGGYTINSTSHRAVMNHRDEMREIVEHQALEANSRIQHQAVLKNEGNMEGNEDRRLVEAHNLTDHSLEKQSKSSRRGDHQQSSLEDTIMVDKKHREHSKILGSGKRQLEKDERIGERVTESERDLGSGKKGDLDKSRDRSMLSHNPMKKHPTEGKLSTFDLWGGEQEELESRRGESEAEYCSGHKEHEEYNPHVTSQIAKNSMVADSQKDQAEISNHSQKRDAKPNQLSFRKNATANNTAADEEINKAQVQTNNVEKSSSEKKERRNNRKITNNKDSQEVTVNTTNEEPKIGVSPSRQS